MELPIQKENSSTEAEIKIKDVNPIEQDASDQSELSEEKKPYQRVGKDARAAKAKVNKSGKKKFDKNNQTSFVPIQSVYIDPNAGKRIAITGGIATGKTYVLGCFKKLGFEIFSADQTVHALLKKDGKAFDQIAAIFPSSVGEDGMDRKSMSEEIVKDPSKLQQMEAILHPLVRSAQVDFMVEVKKDSQKSIVFEVPLLFENKREKYYDFIVLTATGVELQKERAMARPNMTEAKFDLIIKKQLPVADKIKKAHVVIKTNKSFEDTFNQVKRITTKSNVKRDNFRH